MKRGRGVPGSRTALMGVARNIAAAFIVNKPCQQVSDTQARVHFLTSNRVQTCARKGAHLKEAATEVDTDHRGLRHWQLRTGICMQIFIRPTIPMMETLQDPP